MNHKHKESYDAKVELKVSKELISLRKSKDRQYNGKKKTKNDLQNATQKTKDRATRTPLKSGDELRSSGRIASS